MRRLAMTGAMAILLGTSASALAAPTPAPRTVRIADSGKTVTLVPNQLLDVKLVSCPSCGFSWMTDVAPSGKVLRRVSTVTSGSGGNATTRFRYRARGRGTTRLRLAYYALGVTGTPVRRFSLTVRVRR